MSSLGVGNTTCTLKVGETGNWQTVDFEVGFKALTADDGSDIFSTIHIEKVPEHDTTPYSVHQGGSNSIEYDITVPPWSGKLKNSHKVHKISFK